MIFRYHICYRQYKRYIVVKFTITSILFIYDMLSITWAAVRIHKSARNAIPLPPRKRQAPEVPTLRISPTNDANETNEIEPLQATSSSEQVVENLFVEERRKSTPPPPLPVSPPPVDHEESK